MWPSVRLLRLWRTDMCSDPDQANSGWYTCRKTDLTPDFNEDLYQISFEELQSGDGCLIAIGIDEDIATGLTVYQMDTFLHPGGDVIPESSCGTISCSWNRFSHHSAKNYDELDRLLIDNGATEVGVLKDMDCEGNKLEGSDDSIGRRQMRSRLLLEAF